MVEKPGPRPGRWLLLLLACVALAVWVGGYDLSNLATAEGRGHAFARVAGFLRAFSAPDLTGGYLAYVGGLTVTTVAIAVLGTLAAVVFALLLSLFSSRTVFVADAHGARRVVRRVVCELARLLQDVLRGIPDFVWAILVIPIAGLGPAAGIAAITLNVAGILARVYSEAFDAVPARQLDVVRGVGAGRLPAFLYGVLPRVHVPVLSFTLLRWECSVRNASVIGAVGAGGLGSEIKLRTEYGEYDKVLTCLLLMLLLTIGSDLLSAWVRSRLERDPDRRAIGSLASSRQRLLGLCAGVLVVAAASVCWIWPQLQAALAVGAAGWGDRLQFAGDLFGDLLRPDLAQVPASVAAAALPLSMALLATLLGVVAAAMLAYHGSAAVAKLRERGAGYRAGVLARGLGKLRMAVVRLLAIVLRSVPEVFWAYLFVSFFLPGPVAGVAALSLHTIGILVRLYIENVDGLPDRQLQVVQASAGTPGKTFLYGAVPAVVPHWLANGFFQMESNVRTGVVLGIIGVGGLGQLLDAQVAFFRFRDASVSLLVLVVLALVLDRLSRRLGLARSRLAG